jgi:hypothetical protein
VSLLKCFICPGDHITQGVTSSAAENIESIPDALPMVLTKPPIEEHLGWNTLWPETHKLYGHGNELFSMCSDHRGHLLATACKVFFKPRKFMIQVYDGRRFC